MSLASGTKLGPYEILEVIGKGGMGEVYRAQDTRVGRNVAIKVSAERFSERFEREARTIASVNHPNICTLFDVGANYLVMELVQGESLDVLIKADPLPLKLALDYARQIAAALEAAHDKGIVHRDLKPGNIKITAEGTVKVLDFGLAKSTPTTASGPPSEDSPTISMAATQTGVILGTAAYMAPEQARGKAVDKRADIWAFGVVLCEMVTGRRPFQGEDLTDTLAAVVRDTPDLSGVPAEVRGLLERCLEKDPKRRLRDISNATLLLEMRQADTAPARPRLGWAAWGGTGSLAIALAALAIVHFRESPAALQAVRFSIEPPPTSTFVDQYTSFAPSPDGRYVVFSASAADGGQSMLWLRPLDSLTARPLPGTEGGGKGSSPTWSPDSRSLAFSTEGKLKRIEIDGGAPLTLGDAADTSVSRTGSWNRAGVILFGSATGLERVSASGGGATLLTKIDPARQETGHGYPQFLPDGNRFLYFVASGDPNVQGVYASSLDHPEQRQQILRTASKAAYVPPHAAYPGYLLWLQNQTLLAQRFDLNSLRLEGDPVSVAEDIGLMSSARVRASFWASDAGLLIYFSTPASTRAPVVWIGRDGKELGDAAPEDTYNDIALAPGAQRMATDLLQSGSASNTDIWVRDFARGVMTRLTFDPAADQLPVWSPDGKQVAFSSDREGGVFQIFRKDASGAGQEERLSEGPNSKYVVDWSKDGKYILYTEGNSVSRGDLMALPLEGDGKPIPIVKTQFSADTGAFSPDGRWVAYESSESGRREVYIMAFPGAGPKGYWQVSNGGGADIKWRGDGKELYYESLDGKVMAAAIQAGPQGVRIETPQVLFTADFRRRHLREFEVTPDGQRFLLILNSRGDKAAQQRLTVIFNWQAALRESIKQTAVATPDATTGVQ